jgi:RAB protein geranylgeranyltransferase component A
MHITPAAASTPSRAPTHALATLRHTPTPHRGKVHKVPATDFEALRSPLMGLFEKRRARSFFM